MKRWMLSLALLVWAGGHAEVRCEPPRIGAQVFIEPGQTPELIEGFFRTLRDAGFSVARIRMFGSHMLLPDGGWDFSLYDTAFDAAERHGIGLFATLFPPTDELRDVGGFKFPRSKAHLREIEAYVEAVVSHFRHHPALEEWVLQNEPGSGGHGPAPSDLTDSLFARWKVEEGIVEGPRQGRNGWLEADFTRERFHIHTVTWYLSRLSCLVERLDPAHGRHVNPHQLLDQLAEYDFPAYERFLTSLGVSMHLSWHFGWFTRAQYPLGISLMADAIRAGAGKNPFWITEMQGGNVTASGNVPLCPTRREIAQWLWTGIASGVEGIIFWTLNPRAAALEAGEWALLDFDRRPSDRMGAASEVACTLAAHRDFFSSAQPTASDVTLLYNKESLLTQRRNAEALHDGRNEGRMASAPMKSLTAAYEAISSWGVVPQVRELDAYDWSRPEGKTVVLTDMVALPRGCWERLDAFVAGGGRLIATGLTGFYDERMHCLHMDEFPLAKCFGASLTEYKVVAPYFGIACDDPQTTLPAHLWKGILRPEGARVIARCDGEVAGVHNRYGRGEAVWLPSLIELGGWQRDTRGVADFYGRWCREALDRAPLRFARPEADVLMRTMETPTQRMAVVVNKRPGAATVRLSAPLPASAQLIHGAARWRGATIRLEAEGCAVWIWNRTDEE